MALSIYIMTQSWNRSLVLLCATSQPSAHWFPTPRFSYTGLPISGQHPALPLPLWLPDRPGFFLITPDCPLLLCGPGNLSDSGLDTLGVPKGCPTLIYAWAATKPFCPGGKCSAVLHRLWRGQPDKNPEGHRAEPLGDAGPLASGSHPQRGGGEWRPGPIQHHEQLFLHRRGELARNGFSAWERSAQVGRKVSSLSLSTLGPHFLLVPASPCLSLGPGILAFSLDVDILTAPSPVLVYAGSSCPYHFT